MEKWFFEILPSLSVYIMRFVGFTICAFLQKEPVLFSFIDDLISHLSFLL